MKIRIDDFKPGATAFVMGYGDDGWDVKECVILETAADKINRPPHYPPFVIVTVCGRMRKCHYEGSPNSPLRTVRISIRLQDFRTTVLNAWKIGSGLYCSRPWKP